ncbi:MAG: hypothetical protein E6I56_09425 [Chloroflexi bacterium]|nr:MAG: hypothetical protein E6I56_09425 [Chloroflexota bacterium]
MAAPISASADSLPAFGCANASGGTSATAATISGVRIAHHDGYDRLVIGFATSNGVPSYTVQRQASSTFIRDASGASASLEGSAGIKIVVHNADIMPGAPADQKPRLPEVREMANIGNFERVASYGVGLRDQACIRVFELSGPSRLVIDVQTPPDASAASTLSSEPAAVAGQSAATASTSVPQDLAATGQPASTGQHASAPLALIAIGLLVLMSGLAITGIRRFARR